MPIQLRKGTNRPLPESDISNQTGVDEQLTGHHCLEAVKDYKGTNNEQHSKTCLIYCL